MRRLLLIRFAALILMRDFLIPGGGLFLAIYAPVTHSLQPWELPLIAGMLGTPLVARSTASEPEPPEPPSADLEDAT